MKWMEECPVPGGAELTDGGSGCGSAGVLTPGRLPGVPFGEPV